MIEWFLFFAVIFGAYQWDKRKVLEERLKDEKY